MRWWKRMSVTDAQQPTRGRVVPYLRFIRGKNHHNNQIWFRNNFLANQAWVPGFFGQHAVEQCDVQMDVTILGSRKGMRTFRVTHDSTRMNNNNTPNTWLHYDPATLADFSHLNVAGRVLTVERTASGYTLDVT